MPRTAAFVESLQAQYGDDTCPISCNTVDEILADEDIVARVDGTPHPYSVKRLAEWLHTKRINPTTRAPLWIHEVHPIMTPQTDMSTYKKAIQTLAALGWDNEDEIQNDVLALETAQERKRRHEASGVDPFPYAALTRSLLNATPSLGGGPIWNEFVLNRRLSLDRARRRLDDRLFELDNEDMEEEPTHDTERMFYAFMDRRFNAWRFPNVSKPLWFAVLPICKDFEFFYWDRMGHSPRESPMRLCCMMLEWAGQCNLGLRPAELGERQGMAIVHYPPSATEWLKSVMLPRLSQFDRNEWAGYPMAEYAIVDALLEKQLDQDGCFLLFTRHELARAVRDYYVESNTNTGHYVLPARVETSVDRSLLAVDPYTDVVCLSALRYGLSRVNADA